MTLDFEAIKRQAEEEYQQELFRFAVEKYKEKLRAHVSIWDKLFPWKILIIKKERTGV